MSGNEYNNQKIDGAESIISRVRELASHYDIPVDNCLWDKGQEILKRKHHTLEIHTKDDTAIAQFSDEQLTGYTDWTTTDNTEIVLRDMIFSFIDRKIL